MVLKLAQPLLHLGDDSMGRYVLPIEPMADAADKGSKLNRDPEVYANPESILIRLSKSIFRIEPLIS
jgi:hypothetical protein